MTRQEEAQRLWTTIAERRRAKGDVEGAERAMRSVAILTPMERLPAPDTPWRWR